MAKPGPKPGSPKQPGSGRQAGTPNKQTARFVEALEDLEFNIASEAVALFRDPTQPGAVMRFKVLELLADFACSRPKPLETPDASGKTDPRLSEAELRQALNDRKQQTQP